MLSQNYLGIRPKNNEKQTFNNLRILSPDMKKSFVFGIMFIIFSMLFILSCAPPSPEAAEDILLEPETPLQQPAEEPVLEEVKEVFPEKTPEVEKTTEQKWKYGGQAIEGRYADADFVYLEDGTFVNKKLVEEGYAFAYPYKPDLTKSTEIKAAESIARRSKIGLWANCKVTVLTSGRRQTNAIAAQ